MQPRLNSGPAGTEDFNGTSGTMLEVEPLSLGVLRLNQRRIRGQRRRDALVHKLGNAAFIKPKLITVPPGRNRRDGNGAGFNRLSQRVVGSALLLHPVESIVLFEAEPRGGYRHV